MHEVEVAPLLLFLESLLPFGDRHQYDLRPIAANCLQLCQLGVVADDDHAGDADDLRGIGQRLPVVAG